MKTKTLVLLIVSVCINIQSQNITNTLGVSGLFTIKDGGSTFLSLNQSTGFLSLNRSFTLPYTTTSLLGIIFKGNERFIHNFAPAGATGHNTFIGVNSGNFTMTAPSSTNSSYNTGVGFQTLLGNTTGYRNTAVGYNSLSINTSGYDNVAMGYFSQRQNTTGTNNNSFGNFTLQANSTGSYNSAFGDNCLRLITSGDSNSAFGHNAMQNITSGTGNSSFGSSSMKSLTGGTHNSAFGVQSMYLSAATDECSAFGYQSMYSNTGFFNSAFGFKSLFSNTTGWYGSAFGYKTLESNTNGVDNSGFGSYSLSDNTTGDNNSALGHYAGSNLMTGNNNTFLGQNSQPSATNSSNQIVLGDGNIVSLRCNVTTITSLSDARDKKNIKDLDLGIDFLMKLKPRQYNWDKREWYENNTSDGSKMQETPTAGFIAQELDEAQTTQNAKWLNLVLKDNPEKWEATPGNLLPIMVKAIQELKEENDILRNEIETLKKVNDKIAQLEQLLTELKNTGKIIPEVKSVEK